MIQTVSKVYFSPTGNTQKSVDAMASAIGVDSRTYDVTADLSPAPHAFGADDFIIFGMPVYGGRIPKAAAARLAGFTGNQTPCIAVVTYGNRHFDDALLELSELATAQGFVVKGAAALVGRHTYGDIQAHRPDADDLAADRAFAMQAAQNAPGRAVILPGGRPYQDGGNGGPFRPLTTQACTQCGLCTARCPMGAIAADHQTIGSACIACFRCIRICPVHAKHMQTEAYLAFAEPFSNKLSQRRENAYFL